MGENYPAGNAPLGYEQLAVSTVAKPLVAIPENVKRAEIVIEDNDMRYRADGTAPEAAVGTLVKKEVPFVLYGALTLARVQFIRVSGDGKVSVHYYG